MSEPNPYEPPREVEPLTTRTVTKGGPSLTFIVVATPFASVLAGILAVWAAVEIILAAGDAPGWHEGLLVLVFGGAVLITFATMALWAIRASAKKQAS